MAEPKTMKNDGDVEAFLATVEHEGRREDAFAVLELIKGATGLEPSMWGSAIVGFGSNRYTNASGKEAHWFKVGFSPRKQNLTLYIMDGFDDYEGLLGGLGAHSTGKSCLYIKRLSDVDHDVLRTLVSESVKHIDSNQP